jgi:hypothetical protein
MFIANENFKLIKTLVIFMISMDHKVVLTNLRYGQ